MHKERRPVSYTHLDVYKRQFNALSEALMSALQLELDKLAQDDSVRVVVIAAAGKAFCAGHDLREMRASPSREYYQALFKQAAKLMISMQQSAVASAGDCWGAWVCHRCGLPTDDQVTRR